MDKKKLIIMCGPAGAGKTTWVQEHASPGVSAHISRDRIRFEMVHPDDYYFSREDDVYQAFVEQCAQALMSPWVREVYADATHLTKKSRQKLVSDVERHTNCDFEVRVVVVMPDVEVCIAQNAQRTGRAYVPETVIRNMYNSFQSPFHDDICYSYIEENDRIVYGEVSV